MSKIKEDDEPILIARNVEYEGRMCCSLYENSRGIAYTMRCQQYSLIFLIGKFSYVVSEFLGDHYIQSECWFIKE
jgi:hypothetical protein